METSATGTVNFGSRVLLFPPTLNANGDNHQTPSNYPAPALSKNSLVVQIRSTDGGVELLQGGVNRSARAGRSGRVFLLANDGDPDDNQGSWIVRLTRTFPAPATGNPRLAIARIELVQSAQRVDNSVPLISGKPLAVRVFATTGTNETLAGVTGTCRVTEPGGRTYDVSPWWQPGRQPGTTAGPPGSHDRNLTESSLNFYLPGTLPRGAVDLAVRIEIRGSPAQSAEQRLQAIVVDGRSVVIQPYLLSLPLDRQAAPSRERSMQTLGSALARLPIGSSAQILTPLAVTAGMRVGDSLGLGMRGLMFFLAAFRTSRGIVDLEAIRVGFFRAAANANWAGMGIGGTPAWAPSCVSQISANAGFDAASCAHEIGHSFGLMHHDSCGAGIPFSSRLPAMTEEPGWNTDTAGVVPAGTPEMMGYCNPRWPSIVASEFVRTGRHP